MTFLCDSRVRRDTSVSDEMYNITTPDGIWDVALDEEGLFVAAPPLGHPEGYRGSETSNTEYNTWWVALPRFSTASEAAASILGQY